MKGTWGRSFVSRAVVTIGLWALGSLGDRPFSIALVSFLVVAAGWTRAAPSSALRGQAWKLSNIVVTLACLGHMVLEPSSPDGMVAWLCWLSIHGSWNRRGPRGDRTNLLVCGLALCFVSVWTSSSVVLGLVVVFALLMPPLLMFSLEDDSDERETSPDRPFMGWAGLGLIPIQLLLMVGLVWLMPVDSEADLMSVSPGGDVRDGTGLALEHMGRLSDDGTVVLRARVRDTNGSIVEGPFYFPMERFELYDPASGVWSHEEVVRTPAPGAPGDSESQEGELWVQEISLEPLRGGRLLAISHPIGVEMAGGVEVDSAGGWWRRSGRGRVSYRVWSRPGGATLAEAASSLGIPMGLDRRVRDLATEWVSELPEDASVDERVRHLSDRLRETYTYVRYPTYLERTQSLQGFLFSTRSGRGHCAYFASSLALMLRSVGIETRVVHGFLGGEPNSLDGWTRVRKRDAHAWVEARVGDRWVIADATPAVSISDGASILEDAGEWMLTRVLELWTGLQRTELGAVLLSFTLIIREYSLILLSTLLLGLVSITTHRELLALWGRRRFRRDWGAVAVQHARARKLVARKGWQIPSHLPPREAARWLSIQAGPLAEPLETLVWLHYRVRYGGEADVDLQKEADSAVMKLRVLPRRRRA